MVSFGRITTDMDCIIDSYNLVSESIMDLLFISTYCPYHQCMIHLFVCGLSFYGKFGSQRYHSHGCYALASKHQRIHLKLPNTLVHTGRLHGRPRDLQQAESLAGKNPCGGSCGGKFLRFFKRGNNMVKLCPYINIRFPAFLYIDIS